MPHSPELAEQVRVAADLLELLANDRARLLDVPEDDRNRLLRAAGEVSRPDAIRRRALVKATKRQKKAARREEIQQVESQLNSTGIRALRRQPVFTTPNYFLPGERTDEQVTVDDPDFREAVEPQHCYVCKQHYSTCCTTSTTSCAPPCAAFNFAKRTELADLTRARGAAHRRPREDRLPGGHQAAARRRAPHRHHALPARLGRALRRRARLRAVGRTASRSSASTCATRRASRRSATSSYETHDRLDFIVNNACQTVRRPPEFYAT